MPPLSAPQVPDVVTNLATLRERLAVLRSTGARIALTPTMGALHEGHLDLVRLARTLADRVVTSIFVNPRQFAPHEDFDRYPRVMGHDLAMLAREGVDLVWAPPVHVMYGPQFATRIEVDGVARGLETTFRPHFFGGVATVCTKLFAQTGADVAIFGEKDFQQLCVVLQVVRDLDLPIVIVGAPTRREADGLALSSRNAYLSPAERTIAAALNRTLRIAADRVAADDDIATVERDAAETLLEAGFASVDYVAIRDAATLELPAAGHSAPLRVLAAAWLGKTRLIDNMAVTRAD